MFHVPWCHPRQSRACCVFHVFRVPITESGAHRIAHCDWCNCNHVLAFLALSCCLARQHLSFYDIFSTGQMSRILRPFEGVKVIVFARRITHYHLSFQNKNISKWYIIHLFDRHQQPRAKFSQLQSSSPVTCRKHDQSWKVAMVTSRFLWSSKTSFRSLEVMNEPTYVHIILVYLN